MGIFETIKKRRSVRSFKRKPVESFKIKKIIDAGQWAPSACNKQMWEFVVVKNKLIKNKLVEFGAVRFMKDAPVVIYVLYPKKVNPERYANIQSASAAAQNMLLGLGS